MGDPAADCQKMTTQLFFFAFFSGLPKKNWQAAIITGKAMSSTSDNITVISTNVICFMMTHVG